MSVQSDLKLHGIISEANSTAENRKKEVSVQIDLGTLRFPIVCQFYNIVFLQKKKHCIYGSR